MANIINNPTIVQVSGGGDSLWNDFMLDKGTDWSYLFTGWTGTSVDKYLAGIDSSRVTDMSYLCYQGKITSFPAINTNSVTDMSYMFNSCPLTSPPALSSTNKVTNMNGMFASTKIPSFTDTDYDFSNVTTINSFMSYNQKLKELWLLNTGNVTSIDYICNGCILLKQATINTNKCTSMNSAFSGAKILKTVDITSLDKPTSTYGTNLLFNECYVLTRAIIRTMTKTPTINTSAFKNCYRILGTYNYNYNPRGKITGFIFVPDNYVETLKSATNWSTWAGAIRSLTDLANFEPDPIQKITLPPNGNSSWITNLKVENDMWKYTTNGFLQIHFDIPEESKYKKMRVDINTSAAKVALGELNNLYNKEYSNILTQGVYITQTTGSYTYNLTAGNGQFFLMGYNGASTSAPVTFDIIFEEE